MKPETERKRVAILGSTGSIGSQALDVIRQHSDVLEPVLLTAGGNAPELIRQALEFRPSEVVIGREDLYDMVYEALSPHDIKVWAGEEAIAQAAGASGIDIVLAAMVGIAGLKPVIEAIRAGHDIALANKETLVVAGGIISSEARQRGVRILPVDSEHSAIFQCLAGEYANPVSKIILTASGGPFRGMNAGQLQAVTPKEALAHPNWKMGCKVSVDSASLMNKGLEAIEAHWLFGVPANRIEVVVHPQSIIHSLVEFEDGSIKAQMGIPDMRLPIQYALTWPLRLPSELPRFDFRDHPNLSFEEPDLENFRNLALALKALETGGNMPCILNAANEVAVASFLKSRLAFTAMPALIEKVMHKTGFIAKPTLSELFETDREAREMAAALAGL